MVCIDDTELSAHHIQVNSMLSVEAACCYADIPIEPSDPITPGALTTYSLGT
jgi:hypothetical protein